MAPGTLYNPMLPEIPGLMSYACSVHMYLLLMCCVSYIASLPKQFCSLASKGNNWVNINVFRNRLVCDKIVN